MGSSGNGAANSDVDGSTEWQFLQCFGERSPGETIQDADIISAVEFDHDGQHLATGDRGGRVVLFERVGSQPRPTPMDQRPNPVSKLVSFEYRYLTEFQSHEPEFDYLKSLEIEEKINKVRWVKTSAGSRMLLSTNDKTIKLWRVFDKKVVSLSEFNVDPQPHQPGAWGTGHANGLVRSRMSSQSWSAKPLRLPKVSTVETLLASKCRRVYANAHTYHINSISVNSDQETFISADDLRINLWHLDVTDQSFNIVDIKPPHMEDLTEVITSAEFHPRHCNIFAYSSSKGCIRLADMRAAALCDAHAKSFEESDGQRTFFSEIISSISDVKFSRCGGFLLSRDYMTVKLWDLRMEDRPVVTSNVHEPLRSRLCDLYENDCIFDKFDCCVSGDGRSFATGSYANFFKVFAQPGAAGGVGGPPLAGQQHGQGPIPGAPWNDTLLEATRDPLRKKIAAKQDKAHGRFGLPRGGGGSKKAGALPTEADLLTSDFASKLLHLAWHPEANVIAAAASNSLYMYCA